MNGPLVSIVLPVYNGSRHLDDAVDACFGQLYGNWELILVDDASTDDTPRRMEGYKARDRRVRVVHHETNRKLPAALNTGFALARGSLLTWTSDDNCYRTEALAEMVAFLEGRPDVDFVYADHSVIDAAGVPQRRVRVADPEKLGLSNCVAACFMYRRRLAEAVGQYREDRFLVEDYDYWLRCALAGRLAALHKDLYLRRVHAASLSSRHPRRVIERTRALLIEHLGRMNGSHRELKALTHIQLAKLAHACSLSEESRRHLGAALRLSPRRAGRQLPALVNQGVLGPIAAGAIRPVYRTLRRLRRWRPNMQAT